jgi:hypothetical protein
MTKKKYKFGKIPKEYREGREDTHYYWIDINLPEQEIKFQDTCKRMIPFGFEHVKELRKALKRIEKAYKL